MTRVAIIFDGNIQNPKGKVNAILNRIKGLKAIADYAIDVYTIQEYDGFLMRLFLGGKHTSCSPEISLDGVKMRVVWHKRYFLDWFLSLKLHRKPVISLNETKQIAALFKNYDLVISHSFYCGVIAMHVHRRYGTPYFTNWHGSEIHTQPLRNQYQKKLTTEILQQAEMNFFVSQALAKAASRFAGDIKYDILYNGVNEIFYCYETERKKKLRKKYGVENAKVVAFVGNLIDIKNPMLLPDIFQSVKNQYNGDLLFWLIGDGILRKSVEMKIKEYNLFDQTIFWGNQPAEKMPDFMNCIDVLVLPSKNESFGMVLVEAMACGANAVGAKVGGIPEILGDENVFCFDTHFFTNISTRICEMLNFKVAQPLNPEMSWNRTARKEYSILNSII